MTAGYNILTLGMSPVARTKDKRNKSRTTEIMTVERRRACGRGGRSLKYVINLYFCILPDFFFVLYLPQSTEDEGRRGEEKGASLLPCLPPPLPPSSPASMQKCHSSMFDGSGQR